MLQKQTKDLIAALLPTHRMTLTELKNIRNKMIAATIRIENYKGLAMRAGEEATQTLLRAYANCITRRQTDEAKKRANKMGSE